MAQWLATWPIFVAIFGLLVIPGWLLGISLGLDKYWRLALAPALSLAVLAGGAVVLGALKIAWTWFSALLVVIVAVVVIWGLRQMKLLFKRLYPNVHKSKSVAQAPTDTVPALWPILLGVALTAFPAGAAIMVGIHDPAMPPQTWDGVFHINLVRWIIDTGDGSFFHAGAMVANDHVATIYPAAWHDLLAIMGGKDIALYSNVLAVVVCAIIWPAGAAFCGGILAPQSKFMPVATALCAGSFTAYPYALASYGTLWPLLLAYALVLPLLALLMVILFPPKRDYGWVKAQTKLVVALIFALVGIAFTHPQGVIAWGWLALPLLLWWWGSFIWRRWYLLRSGKLALFAAPRLSLVAVLSLPVFAAAGILVLSQSAIVQGLFAWKKPVLGGVVGETFGAIFDAQLRHQGYGNSYPAWTLGVLTLVGVVVAALKYRHYWLPLSWGAAIFLFVSVATVSGPGATLGGFWYSDAVRVGALVPLVGALLAGFGLSWISEGLVVILRPQQIMSKIPRLSLFVNAFVVVALLVGTGGLYYQSGRTQVWKFYVPRSESGYNGLISQGELALMKRLRTEVTPGSVVLGNPYNGSALLYGVAGVKVALPYFTGYGGPDRDQLIDDFKNYPQGQQICAVVKQRRIQYFYTDNIVYWPDHPLQKTYGKLDIAPPLGSTLVDSGGGASLYKLPDCGVK